MPKTKVPYYGGKAGMLRHILPLIPEHKIYVEPFAGGASVFFAKSPAQSEVINDTNNLVVNFYKVVKADFDALKLKIEASLFSRATHSVATTICKMPHLFDKLQQAWAFYISVVMSFSSTLGGAWGYDKYGKRLKTFHNKKLEFDDSIVKRLEHVQIESHDASQVIESRDSKHTFVYCDPPYVSDDVNKKPINQGHYSGYTLEDYKRLLETLSTIKGKFLLSSYPSDLISKNSKKHGWYTKSFDKPITASRNKNGKIRERKIEVLTTNYPI